MTEDLAGYPLAWTVIAVAAAGEDPASFRRPGGPSVLDLLRADEPTGEVATDWQRHALATTAALRDPRTFGSVDYVATLESQYVAGQIGDASLVNDDVFGILALHAVGKALDHEAIRAAATFTRSTQQLDGSWSYYASPTVNDVAKSVDFTAAAVCALVLAGESPGSPVVEDALAWLDSRQRADGAFPMNGATTGASTQATAWVVHAARCAGEDPEAGRWAQGDANPVRWLLDHQRADGGWATNGATTPGTLSDTWATAEALQALTGRDHPLVHWTPASLATSARVLTRLEDLRANATGPASATSWRWDFGDGARGTGPAARHRYATPGSFEVALVASGPGRAAGRATATVTVVNVAPTAAGAASATTAWRGAPVAFTDGGSTDPDGRVVAWWWSFADDAGAWSASPEVARGFAAPGPAVATLRVRDDDGAESAAASVVVDVLNRAPLVATGAAEHRVRVGESFAPEAFAADPDGDAVDVAWDFGDGSPPGVVHAYARAGEFTLAVTARDPFGATATAEARVVVLPAAADAAGNATTRAPNPPEAAPADAPPPSATAARDTGTRGEDAAPPPANEPPALAFASPRDGSPVDGPVVVWAVASDPDGRVAAVHARVAGAPVPVEARPGQWRIPVAPPAPGSFLVEARAVDDAGLAGAWVALRLVLVATAEAPPAAGAVPRATPEPTAEPPEPAAPAPAADAPEAIEEARATPEAGVTWALLAAAGAARARRRRAS